MSAFPRKYLSIQSRNTKKRCEICSKLKIKTAERNHRGCSGVAIANIKHILHRKFL